MLCGDKIGANLFRTRSRTVEKNVNAETMNAEKARRRTEAQLKYDAKATKRYFLKLNLVNDKEIISKLESVGNVQGYIKKLIRKDIGIDD